MSQSDIKSQLSVLVSSLLVDFNDPIKALVKAAQYFDELDRVTVY